MVSQIETSLKSWGTRIFLNSNNERIYELERLRNDAKEMKKEAEELKVLVAKTQNLLGEVPDQVKEAKASFSGLSHSDDSLDD